jgi:hypothetical protein
MALETLDRLQEDKLRTMEGLIESYQASVATGSGKDEAAAIADFLVDEGIGVRQGLRRLWDFHWTMALAGKIPNRLEDGKNLRAPLERGARGLARGATLARTFADWSGREVARLAQFEEQARAFPLWIEECMARWEMLDRPRKPLDRERVARSQAAYARGEGEPVSDVIARLEQGGPLVKE